jgi:hypothetical protein
MNTTSIYTVIKMMETLPEDLQAQVAEHIRDYIDELRDEEVWEALYLKTRDGQSKAAHHARKQINEGQAKPFDVDS